MSSFGKICYWSIKGDNKALYIDLGAGHTDLYDGGKENFILWNEIESFSANV